MGSWSFLTPFIIFHHKIHGWFLPILYETTLTVFWFRYPKTTTPPWDVYMPPWKITGYIWVFPKIVVPQDGWFIMENPIKMDDLGVPLFSETSIYLPTSNWYNIGQELRPMTPEDWSAAAQVGWSNPWDDGMGWRNHGAPRFWGKKGWHNYIPRT